MAKKRIIIVEDDEEILSLLSKRLAREGHDLLTLTRGQGVVQKAKDFLPHLILMDIMLPDMDGADVVQELQKDNVTKDIRVIFLSGIVSKEEGSDGSLKVGDHEYPALPKPFTIEQLLSAINRYAR